MLYETVGESLKFSVKSFFGVENPSYTVSYMTGLDSTDGTVQTTSSADVSISLLNSGESAADFTVTPSDTSCGCYSVDVTLTAIVPTGDGFQYTAPQGFKGFTG